MLYLINLSICFLFLLLSINIDSPLLSSSKHSVYKAHPVHCVHHRIHPAKSGLLNGTPGKSSERTA